MTEKSSFNGPVNRRKFVQALSGTSAIAAFSGHTFAAGLFAGPSPNSVAETAVTEFYNSLSEKPVAEDLFSVQSSAAKENQRELEYHRTGNRQRFLYKESTSSD